MSEEYLATGFTDVDKANDKQAYSQCLASIDDIPYYEAIKRKSYERLLVGPGDFVLDAGCGLGDDVFRLGERVGDCGCVVGLDSSMALLQKASADERGKNLPVQFVHGDLKIIPFANQHFKKCRTDRVLQHVPHPEKAIAELTRVLEPKGLLLAYDNDWSTFTITSNQEETTRIIEETWTNQITNPRIGCQLTQYFGDAGLEDISAYPSTSVITDFETAEAIYYLRQTVKRAVSEKRITESDGEDWIREQLKRSRTGDFSASLTAYTVVGKKPEIKQV